MNDPVFMGMLYGLSDGRDEECRLARGQRPTIEMLVERAAGAVFQGEERRAVVFADLVDLDDIGVGQPGDGLGLGTEADQFLAVGQRRADHLESNEPAKVDLPSEVDDAHASLAQLFEKLVAGNETPSRLRRLLGRPKIADRLIDGARRGSARSQAISRSTPDP